jgi:hypothetical protein
MRQRGGAPCRRLCQQVGVVVGRELLEGVRQFPGLLPWPVMRLKLPHTHACDAPPCTFPLSCVGLLAAVAEGPRATEQFAAVVAVFVAGLAATARAQDISARFLELLAARLEQVRAGAAVVTQSFVGAAGLSASGLGVGDSLPNAATGGKPKAAAAAATPKLLPPARQAYVADDGLACHNLTMLLAYCYSAGVMGAECMYRCVCGDVCVRHVAVSQERQTQQCLLKGIQASQALCCRCYSSCVSHAPQ